MRRSEMPQPTPDAGAQLPTFPKAALWLGIAAILLVGAFGFGINWLVGDHIRTITRSQLEVLTTAEQVKRLSVEKELTLRLAASTGNLDGLERVSQLQQRLQGSMVQLERAIQLPENRRAFQLAFEAENRLRDVEARQAVLIAAGRSDEAERLARQPAQLEAQRTFIARVAEIGARSQGFVRSSRVSADRLLQLAMLANVVAILLIAGALLLVLLPARHWGRQLARMHRDAAAAAQAKADFLAAMSHEIRTPLNGVIGFADLLLDDPALRSDHRRQVGLIQSAGSMLLTIVNDILDLSKIEAGKLALNHEPFAIESLLDEAISIVRPAAQAKGIRLSLLVDPAVSTHYLGDCERLRQIVLNLLNNAVKFTERGCVLVAAKLEDRAAGGGVDELVLSITDTGIGIASDQADRLFQPFTQADSSIAKQFGGTGLGLSICRRLLDLMGGRIWLTSKPGRGSTFYVAVRLARGDAAQAAPDDNSRLQPPPSRLLLVEDLPMNREIAGAILAKGGHTVAFACSGEEGVEMAAAGDYDLVLMDIQMPGIDGVEASRRIRALPSPRGRVPILATTANTLPMQVRAYLEAGMNGHVAKPLKAAALNRAIAQALGRTAAIPDPAEDETDLEIFDAATYEKVRALMPPERLQHHVDGLAALVTGTAAFATDDAATEANAHKIASQAGALGLERLSAAARTLEDACRAGANRAEAADGFAACARDVDALLALQGAPAIPSGVGSGAA
jgi:signal transduction histidine kinase/CheY-like chemotaxis protein